MPTKIHSCRTIAFHMRDHYLPWEEGETIGLALEPTDYLHPCPFCGRTNMELANTHSASYWIECKCGAKVSGKYFPDPRENERPEPPPSIKLHMKAKNSAIRKWNKRA